MDQTLLVNMDIERGSQLLAILEQSKIKVNVALWVNLEEYDDWRLLLSARAFDALELKKVFGLLFESLSAAGIGVEKSPILLILPMTDPFIKELRRKYGKAKNVEGIHLGSQVIGGRFVNDAHVYLIR